MDRPKKLLKFLRAYYKEDARTRRQAEALAAAGWHVDVICLNKGDEPQEEMFEGVRILRVNVSHTKLKSVGRLASEYMRFCLACLRRGGGAMWRREYDLIISHNMPNFTVFAALPAKLRGVPIILDMHDSMLDVFANTLSRGGGAKSAILRTVLRIEERLSMGFANAHVTVTEKFARTLKARSGSRNFFLLHNAPDTSRLAVARAPATDGPTRLLHHGNIHERNGVQNLFPALLKVNEKKVRFILEVQGRGPDWDTLIAGAAQAGVSDYCEFGGPFDYAQIAPRLALANAGVVTPDPSPQMQDALHVKFLEYAACHVPIVARRLETLLHYFPEDCALYYDSDAELISALETLRADPAGAAARADRAFAQLQKISWETERPKFLAFVDGVMSR